MTSVDFTIVGGGVVGLFTALKLKDKFPKREVVLIEKEPWVGHHTSSRHSNVIHSGIYYKKDSLKHLLCINGRQQWEKFVIDHNIEYLKCGKYIFSNSVEEDNELAIMKYNALDRNILDVRDISSCELDEISKYCNAKNAIFIPCTSIIDSSLALKVLRNLCEKKGVIFNLETEVIQINHQLEFFEVQTNRYDFDTKYVINCGGLFAVSLRKFLGLDKYENYYVKGNYLKTHQTYYNKSLLYPIPPKSKLGLGVHTSFELDGIVRFGPNVEEVKNIDYSMDLDELVKLKEAVIEKYKDIDEKRLELDCCGIRPKIKMNNQLIKDFIISSPIKNYIETLGIESPGFTAAPAISDEILSLI